MSSAKPASSSVPQSDKQLSEFLLRVCHDLRGPLRAIRTHGELLAKNESGGGPVSFIVDGSTQAGLLIDGLAKYALALQIEPAAFQPVPLGVVLRGALAKLGGRLQQNRASVTYEDLPDVMGNADRLMQLFEDLVDNALRNRGEEDSVIHIAAEQREDDWLFRVRDNGPGIEPEYLDRLFKPFERIHGKEQPGPGLATCRVIVERHGGSIWAESCPSTFCFTLPADL